MIVDTEFWPGDISFTVVISREGGMVSDPDLLSIDLPTLETLEGLDLEIGSTVFHARNTYKVVHINLDTMEVTLEVELPIWPKPSDISEALDHGVALDTRVYSFKELLEGLGPSDSTRKIDIIGKDGKITEGWVADSA